MGDNAGYNILIRVWATGAAVNEECSEHQLGEHLSLVVPPSLERAEGWLWKALEAGVQPSEAALRAVLEGFASGGATEGIQRMEEVLKQLGHWPSAWACALIAKPHAAAG